MIVFTNTITPRLQYVVDFIGKEITGEPCVITTDANYFKNAAAPRINYSEAVVAEDEFHIQPEGLLSEQGIRAQSIECFSFNSYKAFFKTGGDFPFDIFAAAFYLLSRYEEYLPHRKDIYGRYGHENSLAYKENFLHLPLVNCWIEIFKEQLRLKYPSLQVIQNNFQFIPTYDIDEAWAYRHKQWWRTLAGIFKSIISAKPSELRERMRVLNGSEKDPYDAFDWMNKMHRLHSLKPVYFFLVASQNKQYDKHILTSQPAMQSLIQQHSNDFSIGLHPSWQSGDNTELLKQETLHLENISGQRITKSRQHYIRFTIPDTFRQLMLLGIKSEFSMGYGSINGFRASVTTPYYWYDLEKEKATQLQLYPYCFMDANAYYEQNLLPARASEELDHYLQIIKQVNGTLITIWHNSFLGTAPRFEGWKEVYQQFLGKVGAK